MNPIQDWSDTKIRLGLYSLKSYVFLKYVSSASINIDSTGEIYLDIARTDPVKIRAKFVHNLFGKIIKDKIYKRGYYPKKDKLIVDGKHCLFSDGFLNMVYTEPIEITEYEGYLIWCAAMDAIGMKTNHPKMTDEQIEDQKPLIGMSFDPVKTEILKNLETELYRLKTSFEKDWLALSEEKQEEYDETWTPGGSFSEIYDKAKTFADWNQEWDKIFKDLKTEYDIKTDKIKIQYYHSLFDGRIVRKDAYD